MLGKLLTQVREIMKKSQLARCFSSEENDIPNDYLNELPPYNLNLIINGSREHIMLKESGPPAWEYEYDSNLNTLIRYPFDRAFFSMQSLTDGDLSYINYIELIVSRQCKIIVSDARLCALQEVPIVIPRGSSIEVRGSQDYAYCAEILCDVEATGLDSFETISIV